MVYYAYGSVRQGNPAVVPTDRTYTGQKSDGTGLLYYNARYYDPQLGTFLSPDTLVPDAGAVIDYNRFLYARGNPLRFSDPSGHYSNDEIMQHFGCEDWACVETHFQDGGDYAGMWGWLYMLQMAQDGDTVISQFWTLAGKQRIHGTFQRSGQGAIQILWGGNPEITLPESAYALYAGQQLTGPKMGSYGLTRDGGAVFFSWAYKKHNYLYVDPGELALFAAKSGKDIGPVISAASPGACAAIVTCPAAPVIFTVGEVYTAIGWGTWAITDVIAPAVALATDADFVPALESGASNVIVPWALQQAGGGAAHAAPYFGTAYDAAKLFHGACFGTGCPR